MGLTQYKVKRYEEAQNSLITAILINPGHTSSHLLLGNLMQELNQPVQSLLSYYYFLLLEPNSPRSPEAYRFLRDQLTGNAQKEGNTINIIVPTSKNKNDDFKSAALMLSMFGALNLSEENKEQTEEEKFNSNTESFFKILGELKKKKSKGLWWELYVPFFYDLAKTSHLATYCYYISQSDNLNAVTWLDGNVDKINELDGWLRRE